MGGSRAVPTEFGHDILCPYVKLNKINSCIFGQSMLCPYAARLFHLMSKQAVQIGLRGFDFGVAGAFGGLGVAIEIFLGQL